MAPSGTKTGARYDPIAAFQFKVDLGNQAGIGLFNECGGLEVTMKTQPIHEGGQNGYTHQLTGPLEYGNLVLKRATTLDREFFDWCAAAMKGAVQRRLVTVSLVAMDTHATIFSWTFADAYPVKWSGPSLRSGENGVALETLELAHRGLQNGMQ